jgi:Na+/melibiose symporter-like transporter
MELKMRKYLRQFITAIFAFIFFGCALHTFTLPNATIITGVIGLLIAILVFSPFTLKTRDGRKWWIGSMIMLASGSTALHLGNHSVFAWLLAGVAACIYGYTATLRWTSPDVNLPTDKQWGF